MVNTNKKIGFLISIIILIIIGVFFYWKNLQKELVSLNESLPEGITITKTLTGDYKITNKIDGYSFKAPKIWDGILEIEYIPEEIKENYTVSSLNVEGQVRDRRLVAISQFKNISENINLKDWATTVLNSFDLINNFENYKIENIDTVVTRENSDLMGMDIYFFKKDSNIYSVIGGSEIFIEEIILNGTW